MRLGPLDGSVCGGKAPNNNMEKMNGIVCIVYTLSTGRDNCQNTLWSSKAPDPGRNDIKVLGGKLILQL